MQYDDWANEVANLHLIKTVSYLGWSALTTAFNIAEGSYITSARCTAKWKSY